MGGGECDASDIILCAGASEGIRAVMKLIFNPEGAPEGQKPGVMIPIPQYPLYSATLAEFNMHQIGYYLNEGKNWSLDMDVLEKAYQDATEVCNPRAIVIINPGNPTGNVLSRANIEAVVKFAAQKKLFVFADEVYQDNVYADGCEFHSFKKVMSEMGAPYNTMELASFMSTSKGYMGGCGIRGGYAEICNVDPQVKAMLLKSISAKLCPTVIGQACMDVIVNPPKPGEPSYESHKAQKGDRINRFGCTGQAGSRNIQLYGRYYMQHSAGRDVRLPPVAPSSQGHRQGQGERPGCRRLLRLPTPGEHRNLHHPWIWLRSATGNLPLQNHNSASKGCLGQHVGQIKGFPCQVYAGVLITRLVTKKNTFSTLLLSFKQFHYPFPSNPVYLCFS